MFNFSQTLLDDAVEPDITLNFRGRKLRRQVCPERFDIYFKSRGITWHRTFWTELSIRLEYNFMYRLK